MRGEFLIHECRACRAPVIWAVSVNGRPMPVDAHPAAGGNVRLNARGLQQAPEAVVLAPKRAFGVPGLRKPHHMTCPAGAWFKRKRKGAAGA